MFRTIFMARRVFGSFAAAVVFAVSLIAGPTASAQTLAGPGAPLSVNAAQLRAALSCSGPLTGLTRDPVLLTPAFSTADQSYGAGYKRQLPTVGITTCALTLPTNGYGDLQDAAEYVVAAVRVMSARSGRKIALLGHQHGALDELWALTFWPDIAGKVSDLISLATPYQGTALGAACATRLCAPATWQISRGSNFLAALAKERARSGLPAGPSYTSIATLFDEVIVPQPSVSVLPGATNIQVQSICPARPVEHFSILFDNVVYTLVLDALNHPGAANPTRIPASVCTGPLFMPGVLTPRGGVALSLRISGTAIGALYGAPANASPAEPALRGYAR